jgi:hypothetical protein
LTRRILWRALHLHANALGRRAGDWREVSRVSGDVGGDENRRPLILAPDDDDDLYSRPPPKKGIQKEPEEPIIRSRSTSIPTTAADRDREAAPATGNGSDHESDWNEVGDTDRLEDGLELMSRKEAQKKALKNIKKPVSTPTASVALHADC